MTYKEEIIEKLFNPKSQYENVLILGHGDLDGIASVVAMYEILKPIANHIEKVFTLPHRINQHTACDGYDLIVLVDLAINNRSPQMSFNFMNKYRDKVVWIDHHYLSRRLREKVEDYEQYINRRRKSNLELMWELFPDQKYSPKTEELMRLGHLTDQGDGDNLFNKALKVNLKAEETRYEIFDYCIRAKEGLEMERQILERLNYKKTRYEEVEENSKEAIKKFGKFFDRIAIVDIIDYSAHTVDKTLIPFLLYEEYDVVVTKYLEKKKRKANKRKLREYLTISVAPNCKLNILEVFDLEVGAKFRITIQNYNPETKKKYTNKELVEKISVGLEELSE